MLTLPHFKTFCAAMSFHSWRVLETFPGVVYRLSFTASNKFRYICETFSVHVTVRKSVTRCNLLSISEKDKSVPSKHIF